MLYSLREENEGQLQMPLSPRNNGLDSLFEEVKGFQGLRQQLKEIKKGTGGENNLPIFGERKFTDVKNTKEKE